MWAGLHLALAEVRADRVELLVVQLGVHVQVRHDLPQTRPRLRRDRQSPASAPRLACPMLAMMKP
jgi:hypothetical protein